SPATHEPVSFTLLPESSFRLSGPRTCTPVRCCMLRSKYLPSLSGPLKHPIRVLPLLAGLVVDSPPALLLCAWGALLGGGVLCGVAVGSCAIAGRLMASARERA